MVTDETTAGPTWRRIIELVESMGSAALTERMPPPPDTDQLVRDFPELAGVEVRDVGIDGPHGDVPARLYRAPGREIGAAFVWVHGGAFIFGDLDMAEAHWVGLALAARGIGVLSVDYRKCVQGVHFPVPSDDVLAAWRWAIAHSTDALGAPPARLHLGGASAGGNLVAGVVKRLRDGAGQMPASLTLVYPLVHATLPALSDALRAALAADPPLMGFGPDDVRALNLQFAGTEDRIDDPYAFAANGDVSGQPPVYILNAEADLLRSSGEAYAQQLRGAGVTVTVELEPGTQHGHINDPYSEGGQRSLERMAHWLGA